MNIFLIGFMGSGKTTIGQTLSKELGWVVVDTDNLIENREGLSINSIIYQKGEDYFRRSEVAVLQELMCDKADKIVSCGGGMPCFYDNIHQMNSCGVTVYLRVSPDILYSRLKSSIDKRFLLMQNNNHLKAYIKTTLKNRSIYYLSSQIIVDNNQGVAVCVKEIIEKLSFIPGVSLHDKKI